MGEGRLVRAAGVAERAIGEERVLVPVRGSPSQRLSVLTLNEVGSIVWTALAGPRSSEELAEIVAAEFEVEAAQALGDLRPFLQKLRELDLVRDA